MLPKIQTILYATGLGSGSSFVFQHALSIARQHEAKIVVVHGIEPLTAFGRSLLEQYISHDKSEEMHKKVQESVKGQIRKKIETLCARECDNVSSCENAVSAIHVVDGYPSQVILNVAKDYSADLIIMGAYHHTLVGEVILGSTTRKVLHEASQPVLVVKIPKDHKAESE